MINSVDALDEEEWWLTSEEKKERVKRKGEDHKTSKSKRRKITEVLKSTGVETSTTLHTTIRQLNELSIALQPQLDKLTSVEAQNIKLTKKNFVRYKPSADLSEDTTHLGTYLTTVCSSLSICPLTKEGHHSSGSPLIIIITSSSERASELKSQATSFCEGKGPIIKLCAKHSKISDQVLYLSSHVIFVTVATPNRLHKLISDGHLKIDQLKLLVLDWYWRDKKLKRMQDIPEIWKDFSFLFLEHFSDIKQCKIGLL